MRERETGSRTASVVAFPIAAAPRFRREAPAETPSRAKILLFTGVRYERMPEPDGPTDIATENLRRRS